MTDHAVGEPGPNREHDGKSQRVEMLADIAMVEQLVLRCLRLRDATLQWPQRGRALNAYARQLAIYVIHVNLGLTLTDCAAVYGRDRTTAAHACRKVEDLREIRPVDHMVDAIEQAVGRWRAVTNVSSAVGEGAR